MINREAETEKYYRAREELEIKISEFLGKNSQRKLTLEEIAETIEIPLYWKGFDKPQREVIVSKELSHLVKMGKVEESIVERKEFKEICYYQIKR